MKCSLSHYHISTNDKFQLAQWYKSNFGFEVIEDVESFGEQDGPILISADGGKSGISIFSKKAQDRNFALTCTPAFEVSPEDFIELYKTQYQKDPKIIVYDHFISLSIYLMDPMGTRLEFMSSQHERLREVLNKSKIPMKRINPSKDTAYQEMK